MIVTGMDTRDVVTLLNDYYSIENTLKRRGYDVKTIADTLNVIQTSDIFYENFKSFQFRQILKLIYDSENGLSESEILEKISNLTPDSLSKKLEVLINENCLIRNESLYIKIKKKKISRTFEWFISEIIRREMSGIASSGIKLKNLKSGGDYDVVSRLEDAVVHIECKSGSILNIKENEITNFIGRYKDLAPELSILLIDTDGLPNSFKQICEKADWNKYGLGVRAPKKRRLKGRGVFYELFPRVHVITNEGSLVGNIKLSINYYFSFVKPYGVIRPGIEYLGNYYDEYET